MGELLSKIWYFLAILPFLIFIEASNKWGNFLKKKNIYNHWDIWHAYLLLLIVIFIIFWINGYRF